MSISPVHHRQLEPRISDACHLTASRPNSVDIICREHPDGGPEPVALGQFCNHLDATVPDTFLALGGDASRSHRRNHVAFDGVRSDDTRCVLCRRARTVAAILGLPEIEGVVGVQLIVGNGSRFVGERRYNM